MEQKELRELEARCIQEEPPRCRAGCPFNVDARTFVRAMAEGRFQDARTIIDKSMPLPMLTATLCEAPCERFCVRREYGGAVALGLLERACLKKTSSRNKLMSLPQRPKSAAVIGAGPSSLVVAFELGRKGYSVSIYHHQKSPPGSWLCQLPPSRLPINRLEQELNNLGRLGIHFYSVEQVDFFLIEKIQNENHAVYIGLDDRMDGEVVQLAQHPDPITMTVNDNGLFSGGAPVDTPPSYIKAAAQGREAAVSMDRFLQNVSLTASRPLPRLGRTALFTDTRQITPTARIKPADGLDYNDAEIQAEADRCIDCQCLVCVHHCPYLADFSGYPKKYARQIYNNAAIVKGSHQANTLINSCALCRQCETLCPNDFSMADLCLQAREEMVDQSRMPPSAHAFALAEMDSALSDRTELLHHAPAYETSSAILFPGCQLSGVRPVQVGALYNHLRRRQPDLGIWLSCCGAPAYWAGQRDRFRAICDSFRTKWHQMGKPLILAACASCLQMFRDHLPEVPSESIWNHVQPPTGPGCTYTEPLALSDPCTTRKDRNTQKRVRDLLAAIGQQLVILPMSGELTQCCGYGGLMADANPQLAARVAQSRTQQTHATLLTYCAMCREQMARAGKPSLHLLDLMLPESAQPAEAPPVTLSDRRRNREELKQHFSKTIFQEPIQTLEPWTAIKLDISPEVAQTMEARRILEQDLQQALFNAQQKGTWFDRTDGRERLAWTQLGSATLWIQYRLVQGRFSIKAAWSHRMQIGRIKP